MNTNDWLDLAKERHQQLLQDGERERKTHQPKLTNWSWPHRIQNRIGDLLIGLGQRLKHGHHIVPR